MKTRQKTNCWCNEYTFRLVLVCRQLVHRFVCDRADGNERICSRRKLFIRKIILFRYVCRVLFDAIKAFRSVYCGAHVRYGRANGCGKWMEMTLRISIKWDTFLAMSQQQTKHFTNFLIRITFHVDALNALRQTEREHHSEELWPGFDAIVSRVNMKNNGNICVWRVSRWI